MLVIYLLPSSHPYCQPSTLLQKEMNPEPLKDLELLKTQRSFRHANTGERCPKEREVPEQISWMAWETSLLGLTTETARLGSGPELIPV